MKTRILSALLIVIMVFAISCQKSDSNSSDTGQIVTSGTWKISLFTDSGNNETTDFNSYTFTFSDGGTLTAVKSGVTKTGTWSVSSTSNKFNIDMGPKIDTNKPLGELTDDWKIISKSATEIRLTDDNAASNEFLTFTKN
jgi:hypothetical protein